MARLGFKAAWDFGRAVAGLARGGESARSATVTRVDEDGTVWVRMAGAESEVPLDGTLASAQVGDVVSVGWLGGAPSGEGNASDPSAGGRSVSAARKAAQVAEGIAEQAQAVADAINQHFWADGNGVHVTEAEGDPTTEHNILINSLGILLRKAASPLVSITQSAIAFYDGLGSAASNIVAQFGADGARVGKAASYNLALAAQRIALMLGDDSLVDLSTNGITTTLKFAGSTQAAGTNYTDAEVFAIETYLNDGTITIVGDKVYRDGEDTGYTVELDYGSTYIVKDSQGNNIESGRCYLCYSTTYVTPFFTDDFLSPMAEIDGAPVVMKMGGVSLIFQDKSLSMDHPLPAASGGTGIADYGTYLVDDDSAGVSVANNAWTTVNQLTLGEGRWLLRYDVEFPSNATGWRGCGISTASGSIGAANLRQSGITVPAANGAGTRLNGSRIVNPTGSTTYYLVVRQNSGSALTTTSYIQAVKIG